MGLNIEDIISSDVPIYDFIFTGNEIDDVYCGKYRKIIMKPDMQLKLKLKLLNKVDELV